MRHLPGVGALMASLTCQCVYVMALRGVCHVPYVVCFLCNLYSFDVLCGGAWLLYIMVLHCSPFVGPVQDVPPSMVCLGDLDELME